ncbi:hypothetical protein [Thiobacillus denitrificans]|nr:hypothetical protein [Thiobacillus denitrificans]
MQRFSDDSFPDVTQRSFRSLMLWLFIALQAIAPLIHAHAGTVRLDHAGFMHLHQGSAGDPAGHAAASDAQGAEFAVAAGVRLRPTLAAVDVDGPTMAAPTPPLVRDRSQASSGPRAPPAPPIALPAHTRPLALAPPAR